MRRSVVVGMARKRHPPGGQGQCYPAPVGTQVIVLNGTSSAGKTSIGRCLQSMLSTPWLLLGIDDLTRAVPDKGIDDGTLLHVRATGQVEVGPGWRRLEGSWYVGIATIAASGTGVIVDEVFLDGGAGQQRLRAALSSLQVLWIGVTCDRDIARAREVLRPDRVVGQADSQAPVVHEDVEYDLVVDTSRATSESCAAMILERVSTTV
jgi:chloramphenicol 3-O phosphotransferase